jgi:hypothetical protein
VRLVKAGSAVTAQPSRRQRKRSPASPDRLSDGDVRALMRRSYQEPIPVWPAPHQMARRRQNLSDVDHQDHLAADVVVRPGAQ